jgi:DNA helicase II / ATP-dependent DNA helicase PcrA
MISFQSAFVPRPAQLDILSYTEGTMGVSAVPGSGKTWTLSYLASELIRKNYIAPDQEILIVTLVNSAVSNFSQRISSFLDHYGLIPSLGYRVRTLHGLAHDIVKERPELAGLDTGFQIIDDREAIRIRDDAVYTWLKKHPSALEKYLLPDLNKKKIDDLYQKQIPALINQLSLQFIKSAKNLLLSPAQIRDLLSDNAPNYPLALIGLEIYEIYQRNLEYSGAVDFDDLINKAYQVLSLDTSLLSRLQRKWPYILEDEAQDSSLMQQQILSLLSNRENECNWVRVGDPNQAIYESFTTADPALFNRFVESADHNHILPNSGRNSKSIINLANYLVSWTNETHPEVLVRDALFPNKIIPTPSGDSQPNPIDKPDQVHLHNQPLSSDEEISLVARSVTRWLAENPNKTAAILAPRNERGKKIASTLRSQFNIEPVELLNTTIEIRKTTGALVRVLSYLLDPISPKKLAAVYEVFNRDKMMDPEAWSFIQEGAEKLREIKKLEQFITSEPSPGWLEFKSVLGKKEIDQFEDFRQLIIKWHQAILLPIDQLILTISGDIFQDQSELSLSHKIALFQRQLANQHPDWELPALLDELKSLARNERRFFGTGDQSGFNPDEYKGKVVITTAHKAKGLEWDRVYLMSVNNYNFPSGDPDDSYISEKWFVRDHLNLPSEALSQLNTLYSQGDISYIEGEATRQSRLEYIRERLRLLYVSITRAKQELVITWNTGYNSKYSSAAGLIALSNYYKKYLETVNEVE